MREGDNVSRHGMAEGSGVRVVLWVLVFGLQAVGHVEADMPFGRYGCWVIRWQSQVGRPARYWTNLCNRTVVLLAVSMPTQRAPILPPMHLQAHLVRIFLVARYSTHSTRPLPRRRGGGWSSSSLCSRSVILLVPQVARRRAVFVF